MPLIRPLLVAASAAIAFAVPGAALATSTTVQGEVTSEVGGAPLEGARVVIMDRNGPGTADDRAVGVDTTDAGGDFAIVVQTGGAGEPADNETVDVVVHDAGTQVESTSIEFTGATVVTNVSATPSGTQFAALDIFGGQVGRVIAGGAPCEFYLTTSVIPQIFVTVDCGGTWAPVTTRTDSATQGLDGSMAIHARNIATTGVPCEVAALVNQTVYYSRDCGVTWSAVLGTTGTGAGVEKELFWGHVRGGNDVILVRNGLATYTADLTAATPTFGVTTGYIDDLGDRISVAGGVDHPYIAVAEPLSGGIPVSTVRTWRLTADATPYTGGISGLDTSLQFPGASVGTALSAFALTGGTGTSNGPPDVIVAGLLSVGADRWSVFLDENDTAQTFQVSKTVGGTGLNCGEPPATPTPGTSVLYPSASSNFVPRASGDVNKLSIVVFGSCSRLLDARGDVPAAAGFSATGGQSAAIDPSWGTNDFAAGPDPSRVLIAPQGDRGVQKSSAMDVNNVPVWPASPPDVNANAVAGIGSSSGGIAVQGLTVPVVKDVAFGPSGASDVAVMFSMSGGGLCLASSDGLATAANVKPVVNRGGNSVAWWGGSGSDDWILCGHGDGTMSAIRNWTPSSALVANSVETSGGAATFNKAAHGLNRIEAADGLPGASTVFVGGNVDDPASPNDVNAQTGRVLRLEFSTAIVSSVERVRVQASVPAFDVGEPVSRVVYCPAGSAAGFSDVLFIGTGWVNPGGAGAARGGRVYRLANASTAPNGSAPVALAGSGTTGVGGLDVHCASGTLYAGFQQIGQGLGAGSSPALQKSTDGTTLSTVRTAGELNQPTITALAINPSAAGELIMAADSEGRMWGSLDGGATLVVVNNPQQVPGGVNFNSEGVRALALPPGLTRSASVRAGGFHERSVGVRTITQSSTAVGTGGGAYRASFRSALPVPSGGSGGSGGGGGGGGGDPVAGTPAASAAPAVAARATLAISGAKWDKKRKGVVLNVNASAAGRVTLVVSLKQGGGKLKKVGGGSAAVKAGANKAVLFKMRKPPKGAYVLAASHANGAEATGALRVK